MPLKPVKNTIVGLKKTHSMHGGPKSRPVGLDPVPLPKDTGAGVKVVRLVSEQQGFSVAYAAVTLQKDPPRTRTCGTSNGSGRIYPRGDPKDARAGVLVPER
jgi:hypothetical protein